MCDFEARLLAEIIYFNGPCFFSPSLTSFQSYCSIDRWASSPEIIRTVSSESRDADEIFKKEYTPASVDLNGKFRPNLFSFSLKSRVVDFIKAMFKLRQQTTHIAELKRNINDLCKLTSDIFGAPSSATKQFLFTRR